MDKELDPSLVKCLSIHWRGVVMANLSLLFLIAMLINDDKANRCLYLIVFMYGCWIGELFPLAITAMMPIVALPLMNIMKSDLACSLFFKNSLVMFIVCVMIACSIEYTDLHRCGAIHLMRILGSNPRRLHFVLVAAAMILSTFVPNSVAAAIMYPFTFAIMENLANQGVCKMYEDDKPDTPKSVRRPSRVMICFYLSVAFACSMGGSCVLTGSPTNLEIMKVYDQRFPEAVDKITYGNYMLYALPQMLISAVLMYVIIEFTHMGLFRKESSDAMALQMGKDEQEAATVLNDAMYGVTKHITMGQSFVAMLLVSLILMMFTRKPMIFDGWGDAIKSKQVEDASPAALIVYLVFAIPANFIFLMCWDEKSTRPTPKLLTWKYLNTFVPWDLIFIIGCGGSIAEGVRFSGLGRLLGDFLCNLKTLPRPISLIVLIVVMILMTNFTGNTAVLRFLGPGIIQMAIESSVHPLYFLLPSGLMSSMAFMMPQATGPNALFAAYGSIRVQDIFKAGFGPTIAAMVTIYIFAQGWGMIVYPEMMEFPNWITENLSRPDYGEPVNV